MPIVNTLTAIGLAVLRSSETIPSKFAFGISIFVSICGGLGAFFYGLKIEKAETREKRDRLERTSSQIQNLVDLVQQLMSEMLPPNSNVRVTLLTFVKKNASEQGALKIRWYSGNFTPEERELLWYPGQGICRKAVELGDVLSVDLKDYRGKTWREVCAMEKGSPFGLTEGHWNQIRDLRAILCVPIPEQDQQDNNAACLNVESFLVSGEAGFELSGETRSEPPITSLVEGLFGDRLIPLLAELNCKEM